jgi:hypothetical protein
VVESPLVVLQTSFGGSVKLFGVGKKLSKAAFGKGNLYTVNVCGLCKMTICQVPLADSKGEFCP